MVSSIFVVNGGFAKIRKWGCDLIRHGMFIRLFDSKPIWAQVKITDRCNLRCAYCSESKECGDHVDFDTISRRLLRCSRLGIRHVELFGGEPLLHPDLIRMITTVKKLGMSTGLTTNGFLLDEKLAGDLAAAGICRLQISIDCIEPNAATGKALNLLLPQLDLCANMHLWVHVNSVLTEQTLPQARELADRLFAMGIPIAFSPAHSFGILTAMPAGTRESMLAFFDWLSERKSRGSPVDMPQYLIDYYQSVIAGKPVPWTCEGGCKFFYVDCDGNFCMCGHKPTDKKFEEVDRAVLLRFHGRKKGCEEQCGIACMVTSSLPLHRADYVVKSELLPRSRSANRNSASRNPDKKSGKTRHR